MALRPRFSIAAQKAQAEKEQRQYNGNAHDIEDDEESVKGMARLFAELGEAYTALIATGTHLTPQVGQCLLCSYSYRNTSDIAHCSVLKSALTATGTEVRL